MYEIPEKTVWDLFVQVLNDSLEIGPDGIESIQPESLYKEILPRAKFYRGQWHLELTVVPVEGDAVTYYLGELR